MSGFRAVLTGGDHCGKTTMIQALTKIGYDTIPEAAIMVISEEVKRRGLEDERRWQRECQQEFQNAVARRQSQLEQQSLSNAQALFLDRGLLDGFAYCKLYGIQPPGDLQKLSVNVQYDAVFVLDLLPTHDARNHTGRIYDRSQSEKLGDLLFDTYRAMGMTPIRVPALPVLNRVEFLLKKIPQQYLIQEENLQLQA